MIGGGDAVVAVTGGPRIVVELVIVEFAACNGIGTDTSAGDSSAAATVVGIGGKGEVGSGETGGGNPTTTTAEPEFLDELPTLTCFA